MLDLDEMIKLAMKQHDKDKVKAYRNVKAKIVNAKTSPNTKEYNDNTETSIIAKYVKELKEASECYFAADRDDLGVEYLQESEILSELIPREPTEEEIKTAIFDFIQTYNAPIPDNKDNEKFYKSQFDYTVKYVKGKYPTADEKKVSGIIKSLAMIYMFILL